MLYILVGRPEIELLQEFDDFFKYSFKVENVCLIGKYGEAWFVDYEWYNKIQVLIDNK